MKEFRFFTLCIFLLICSNQALAKKRDNYYILREVPSAVVRFNEEFSDTQITSISTYKQFHHKDPKLPPWGTLAHWYEKKHGDTKDLARFIFPKRFYALEEIPLIIERINADFSEEEQIRNISAYEKFRFKDPKLPSWMTLARWYQEEHGIIKGLSGFIFQKEFYDLEEVPSAVANVNKDSSEEEQIRGQSSYKSFYYKDLKLPSWTTLARWYQKEHGSTKGLADFVLQRRTLRKPPKKPPRRPKLYVLQEVPSAVANVNKDSSEKEQMNSRVTYEDFRDKDLRLPSWMTLVGLFKETYGHGIGVSDFVFKRKLPNPVPPKPRPKLYTLEEVPSAIISFNIKFFGEAHIKNQHTYEGFRSKDPKLPSWGALVRWYKKTHGSSKGLADFMFSRSCEREMATL